MYATCSYETLNLACLSSSVYTGIVEIAFLRGNDAIERTTRVQTCQLVRETVQLYSLNV